MLRRLAGVLGPLRLARPAVNRVAVAQSSIPSLHSTPVAAAATRGRARFAWWTGGVSAVAAAILVPSARQNWKQSTGSTHVSYLLGDNPATAHRRLEHFVDNDGHFYGIHLKWDSPQQARIVGDNLHGTITLDGPWVKMEIQLEGFLRLQSKAVLSHIIRRFSSSLEYQEERS